MKTRQKDLFRDISFGDLFVRCWTRCAPEPLLPTCFVWLFCALRACDIDRQEGCVERASRKRRKWECEIKKWLLLVFVQRGCIGDSVALVCWDVCCQQCSDALGFVLLRPRIWLWIMPCCLQTAGTFGYYIKPKMGIVNGRCYRNWKSRPRRRVFGLSCGGRTSSSLFPFSLLLLFGCSARTWNRFSDLIMPFILYLHLGYCGFGICNYKLLRLRRMITWTWCVFGVYANFNEVHIAQCRNV